MLALKRIKFFEFSIFFLGTLYVNYHYNVFPPSFYENWRPISFYQLLSGPLSQNTLLAFRLLWTLSALLAGLGIWRKSTGFLAFLFAALNLGHNYNFGNVYHGYSLYMGSLIFLGLGPLFAPKHETTWLKTPLKLWIIFVMTITGLQKLYYGGGLDWAFSDAFWVRLATNPYKGPFTNFLIEGPLWYSMAFAGYALFIVEVLAPLALINKKFGYLYFFLWSSFHLGVTLSFGNHYMFYSQVFVYAVFLDRGEN